MKIDIKEFLINYIGHLDWYGETNHDNQSADNMVKADDILDMLEDIRDDILYALDDHRNYRKGNASAEMLHEKAGKIVKKHRQFYNYTELTDEEFKEYWDGE